MLLWELNNFEPFHNGILLDFIIHFSSLDISYNLSWSAELISIYSHLIYARKVLKIRYNRDIFGGWPFHCWLLWVYGIHLTIMSIRYTFVNYKYMVYIWELWVYGIHLTIMCIRYTFDNYVYTVYHSKDQSEAVPLIFINNLTILIS